MSTGFTKHQIETGDFACNLVYVDIAYIYIWGFMVKNLRNKVFVASEMRCTAPKWQVSWGQQFSKTIGLP